MQNDDNFVNEYVKGYKKRLIEQTNLLPEKDIAKIINILHNAGQKNIFIAGNGGSAATASHMACDLSKTVLSSQNEMNRLRAYSLSDNIPCMTAIGNDWSYDDIFSEQLKNLLNEGDIVILISGSGNSPNIIKAAEYAKKKKATIIGFTGFDGGKLSQYCDIEININSKEYGIIEDLHMALDHMIAFCIKEMRKMK